MNPWKNVVCAAQMDGTYYIMPARGRYMNKANNTYEPVTRDLAEFGLFLLEIVS